MKRISAILIVALLMSAMTGFGLAEGAYSESPVLSQMVADGLLPPVEERLPEQPKLIREILEEYLDYEIGNYGGTMKTVTTSVNWDAGAFVNQNEALLSMSSDSSDEIIGNILESYETNEECTEFVFRLRKGLCWSDGTPVTMTDFAFTYNDFIMNAELNPVIAATMRSGGKTDGTPMTFEPLDDWSYKVTFDSSYGGFLVYMSIKGWAGYTDLLKPAHYLKPFHIAYAEECHGSLDAYYEFIAPFALALGYDDPKAEGVWCYVFNQIDMTNWELTDPVDALTSVNFPGLADSDFPVLYAWMMESSGNNVTRFTRNPYYFKVDAAGQQLPYMDYFESSYVENAELQVLAAMSGDVTFASLAFDYYTMLAENLDSGNFALYTAKYHNVTPTIFLNETYGLNADGSVKDDADSHAWQEVATDIRFRQALTMAIDANELVDTLYLGFASANERYNCVYDIDGANALLDEMGMLDIDGDGRRETPSGKKFAVQIWTTSEYPDYLNGGELYVDYWAELGLSFNIYTTDTSLYATSQPANEMPMCIELCHATELWHYLDWGFGNWDVLWDTWVKAGGLTGEIADSDKYLAPPESYIDFRLMVDSLMQVNPETAVNEVLPVIADTVAADMYVIIPVIGVSKVIVTAADMGNIPTGGLSHSWQASAEELFLSDFIYE